MGPSARQKSEKHERNNSIAASNAWENVGKYRGNNSNVFFFFGFFLIALINSLGHSNNDNNTVHNTRDLFRILSFFLSQRIAINNNVTLVKTIKLQNVDIDTPVGTIQTVVLSGGESEASLSHSGALIIKNSLICVVTAQVWLCADCSHRPLQFGNDFKASRWAI